MALPAIVGRNSKGLTQVTDHHARDEALARLSDIDASGEVSLVVRRRLKDTLTHLLGDDGRALTFVALLGLTCARQSWAVWLASFPSESRPMDLAESAVSGAREGSGQDAVNFGELMAVKTDLENKLLLGENHFRASYPGFASWAVA